MIVRLRNLSARSPVMADLQVVTALMVACDAAESGIADPTEKDVLQSWQAADFTIHTDAWIVTAHSDQAVGYADVHRNQDGLLTFVVYVHPRYRGRGIGTLLVWLVEERARQMLNTIPTDLRVALSITVSSMNAGASAVLEREGYTQAHHLLRLLIEMDETAMQAPDTQDGKIKMDLLVDARNMLDATPLARRTGIYVARQYHVFEKELRMGKEQHMNEEHTTQLTPA